LQLFDTPYFRVGVVADSVGVQICGALKNVIAVGAGICDGLKYVTEPLFLIAYRTGSQMHVLSYRYGHNTKSAVIRRGLLEMRKFGKSFFGGVRTETFFG
jgi:glycerol-3-phosphate dehydrogenase (NAD+)